MMKTVIYTIAFIGLAQCAKLDHLKYLPPDSRSPNKESFDQGLAAPTTAQAQGPSGSEPQQQRDYYGQARSLEPQPTPTGSFNAGSQNAARLQGAPFLSHESQSSGPASQQNRGFSVGQQDLNKPIISNEPSDVSSTFGSTNQGSQPSSGPQNFNQQQGFSQKPISQSTNQFQGSSPFGSNTKAGSGSQPTNQPHGTYGVPDSQSDVSDGIQSAKPSSGPQNFNQQQGFSQKPISQSTNQFQGSSPFGSNTKAGSGSQPTNQPHGTYGVPDSQSDVSDGIQSAKPSSGPQNFNQQQGFSQKPISQSTNQFQGSSPFGSNTKAGSGSQPINQPHGTYGVPDSQSDVSDEIQSAKPSVESKESTFGQNDSSSTFLGTSGSGPGLSHGSSFAQNGPAINNFNSQPGVGAFGSGPQSSESYESSRAGKNIAPNGPFSSNVQPSQTFGVQQQGVQSPRSFDAPSASNVGPGKSTGFLNSPSSFSQSKYQPSSQNQIPIIRLDTKNYGDGTYSTAYETGNGIKAEEQGQTQGDHSIAQGSFSYTSPEGEKVGITYTADEDGYHPQGEHLPTPPPVPEAILKSLEYNKAHPEEENDDGSYKESDEPESSDQYSSPFGKTQYPGSSNKYLAPTSGAQSQLLGGSSTQGKPISESSRSYPSQDSSSNQATFSPSTNDKPQNDFSTSFTRGSPNSNIPSNRPSFNQANLPSSGYSSSESDKPQGSSSLAREGLNAGSTLPSHGSTSNQATFPSSSYSSSTNDGLQGGSPTRGSLTVGTSVPSHAPSFSQATFPSSSYPTLASNEPQNDGSISISAPASSNYGGQSSLPSGNKQTFSSSGYQYKPPSSSESATNYPSASSNRAFPSLSFGASINQPTQKPGYSGFNSPLSSQPGLKSESIFGKSSNSPQGSPAGQFTFQDSTKVEPSSPQGSAESYGSPRAFTSNVPQRVPSNQFSSHQSTSGPVKTPGPQAGTSFGSSYPGASQGIAASQQGYQNTNNGPNKDSENARFAPGSLNNENKQVTGQYSGSTGPQVQPNPQSSYSSGPSRTQSTQFSGYQYNAPNTPFGRSQSSNLQQPIHSEARSFPSGTNQGPEGSSNNTPFGNSGLSSFPQPNNSQGKAFPSVNYQGPSKNNPSGSAGSSSFSQPSNSQAKDFPSGNAQGPKGLSNNSPFGNQRSLNFPQPGLPQPKAFNSGNTQGTEDSSASKFGPGQAKIVGEFGPGEFRSNSGPVRTPGVQAQDENGGYLY